MASSGGLFGPPSRRAVAAGLAAFVLASIVGAAPGAPALGGAPTPPRSRAVPAPFPIRASGRVEPHRSGSTQRRPAIGASADRSAVVRRGRPVRDATPTATPLRARGAAGSSPSVRGRAAPFPRSLSKAKAGTSERAAGKPKN